jgi:RimJ/RimL family protein N-acetyltransferase
VTTLATDAPHRAARHVLTGRLDLRAVGLADADALHPILGDPRNSRFLPGGALASPGDTRAWLERFGVSWQENGLGYWTVRLRADGTVIGVGGAERRPEFWNLLYFLDRDHWGNGYATELARAAQSAARSRDPGLPLAAWIHEQNTASQAVARRLGLRDHGLRDHGLVEAGHWQGEPMHYWADRAPPSARRRSAPRTTSGSVVAQNGGSEARRKSP